MKVLLFHKEMNEEEVFFVSIYSCAAKKHLNRVIDLAVLSRSPFIMEGEDARAFRMLFGLQKTDFKTDSESSKEKFQRLFQELGVTTRDLDILFETVVEGRPTYFHQLQNLYKMGIFLPKTRLE